LEGGGQASHGKSNSRKLNNGGAISRLSGLDTKRIEHRNPHRPSLRKKESGFLSLGGGRTFIAKGNVERKGKLTGNRCRKKRGEATQSGRERRLLNGEVHRGGKVLTTRVGFRFKEFSIRRKNKS